jgi:hypothetical protein
MRVARRPVSSPAPSVVAEPASRRPRPRGAGRPRGSRSPPSGGADDGESDPSPVASRACSRRARDEADPELVSSQPTAVEERPRGAELPG